MNKDIMVVGDVHGNWGELNTLINRRKPKMILQCGDMGIFPHYHGSKNFDGTGKPWNYYNIKNPNTDIYFADGNHENFDYLDELIDTNGRKNPIELPGFKNVFYMPRASVFKLPDGRNVMFMGGALSIDKDSRIIGNTWWHQEEIQRRDMEDLPDIKIDIMITHTLPSQCYTYIKGQIKSVYNDNSCRWLDIIFDEYRPKKWYFGHMHLSKNFIHRGTSFTCLDMCGNNSTWWEWLK